MLYFMMAGSIRIKFKIVEYAFSNKIKLRIRFRNVRKISIESREKVRKVFPA